MAGFINRLKYLLAKTEPAVSSPNSEDPLDYDQLVHLDAEDLAEQGILSAYQALLPRLKQFTDSPIEVTEELDHDSGRYTVCFEGLRYAISFPDDPDDNSWIRATVAFFDIVNANLRKSSHKFYALYGANDLGGIFLTEEEYVAARQAIKERSNWPWMPVNWPPDYGYPNKR